MISKEIKFLLTHSSIYGLGTMVSRLVAFVLLPLYTRYLTPTDYGVLETIDISSGIIGIVLTVGIARALSRFYYESDEEKERKRVVSTTYITYFIIAGSCIPLLYFSCDPLANILFKSGKYSYYFLISFAALFFGGIVDIGMVYLRLIKKPAIFVSITVIRLILLISLNILFIVYYRIGVLGILYSSFIVRILSAIILTGSIFWKIKARFSFGLSWDLLKYGLPMIPSTLANAAVKQSDKYFVLYLISVGDMGIYSLALKLGNAIHSLLTIPFNMAYIPRRFEIMKRGNVSETYSQIFTYYIFLTTYIGLSLSMLIPEILQVMVTPEFRKAGELVPLVVFSMIIFGCHYHFDFGILYSKKTKYLAYINILCAVFNIGLNYSLISNFGLFGGVWAAIIILGFQAMLLYYFSEKHFHIEYEFRRIFIYILLAIIFYIISTQIHAGSMILNMGIKLMLLILFPLTVTLFKIITPIEKSKIIGIYNTRIKLRKRLQTDTKST